MQCQKWLGPEDSTSLCHHCKNFLYQPQIVYLSTKISSTRYCFQCASFLPYVNFSRKTISQAKFSSSNQAFNALSSLWTEHIQNHHWKDKPFDAIAYPPSLFKNVYTRSGNLLEDFVSDIMATWQIKHRENPVKIKAFKSNQKGLGRSARLENALKSFYFQYDKPINRLLIVDDIITSGATIRAIARLAFQNQITEVYALTLARTPL